jgi:hypothetical protein
MAKFSTARLAPIDSPSLAGNPTGITAAPGDSDTSLATTAFVANALSGFTSGNAFTASSTAPSSPHVGDLWFDLSVGMLSIYVNDGTSSQWIQVSPAGTVTPSTRVLLQTLDPAGTPFAVLGPMPSTYDSFEIDGLLGTSTNDQALNLQYSTDNAVSWINAASSYHYAYAMPYNAGFAGSGAAAQQIQINPISTATVPAAIHLKMMRPWHNGSYKHCLFHTSGWGSAGTYYAMMGSGAWMAGTIPVTHVRLFYGAAPYNFTSGGFVNLYGLK